MRKIQGALSFCSLSFVSPFTALSCFVVFFKAKHRSLVQNRLPHELAYVNAITTNTVTVCRAWTEQDHSCSQVFRDVKHNSGLDQHQLFFPDILSVVIAAVDCGSESLTGQQL